MPSESTRSARTPVAGDGREALWILLTARARADTARTAAVNTLKSLVAELLPT